MRRLFLGALLLMGLAVKHISEAERKEITRGLFQVTKDDSHRGELHGLCPIHGEKNPSFSYSYKKDKYNCFACGASGDLIRLWTEVHGHGQKDGFKAFCEKYGLSIGEAGHYPSRGPSRGASGPRKGKIKKTRLSLSRNWRPWRRFRSRGPGGWTNSGGGGKW